MNCLTEALGMGLPGTGTIPAVWAERIRLAKGLQIMELVKRDLKPSDILTTAAFENAPGSIHFGGSTNTAPTCRRSPGKWASH